MKKVISLILCSRNDNYMGNPVGRLEMAINFAAKNAQLLGREEDVEILVSDWGSKVPLREVLKLNAAAAKITQFVEVPITVVKETQKDSPFAEVIALNAAARRASGQYIGRIDQDTLIGKRFLKKFFEWTDGVSDLGVDLKTSYLFSKRRQIPFEVAMRVSTLKNVERFLMVCKKQLLVEEFPADFFYSPVGIMILSNDLWTACGGYDERMLYWGWMEVDLALRLKAKCALIDIGPLVNYDFYHLEHYDPRLPRVTARKTNPQNMENLQFHPNAQDCWGLIKYGLTQSNYAIRASEKPMENSVDAARPEELIIVFKNAALVYFQYFFQRSTAADIYRKTVGRGIVALGKPARYQSYLKRIISRIRVSKQ